MDKMDFDYDFAKDAITVTIFRKPSYQVGIKF